MPSSTGPKIPRGGSISRTPRSARLYAGTPGRPAVLQLLGATVCDFEPNDDGTNAVRLELDQRMLISLAIDVITAVLALLLRENPARRNEF